MNDNENNGPVKKHNGATNLFLTLLRKNQDEVKITVATGETQLGVIVGFDEVGIIMGVKLYEKYANQIYITRSQLVTIVPVAPVVYLSDY